MKILKMILVGCACMSVMASSATIIRANNSDDKEYDINIAGDGSDMSTTAQPKEDNTYTYVRHDKGKAFKFAAQAKRGIKRDEFGDPNCHDYSSEWHTLDAGKRIYIKNDTYKKKIANTYLTLCSTDHKAHTYKGVWSPDNMSGFGEP